MDTFLNITLILAFLALMTFSAALYGLPIYLAYRRKAVNFNLILLMTLAFGWTVVGWVVALILVLLQPIPELETQHPLASFPQRRS